MRQTLIVIAMLAGSFTASAQSTGPRFEVASIRPVQTCDPRESESQGQMKSGAAPAAAVASSPDRLIRCGPVGMLIRFVYLGSLAKAIQANPLGPRLMPNIPIEGGPDWLNSDSYMIVAKTDRPVSRDVMEGPMLRALLEDRFKLKIHRASKMSPAYALTVAKGGLKLRKSICTPPAFGPDAPPYLPEQRLVPWRAQ